MKCMNGPRDVLPEDRHIFSIELTYNFHVVSFGYELCINIIK